MYNLYITIISNSDIFFFWASEAHGKPMDRWCLEVAQHESLHSHRQLSQDQPHPSRHGPWTQLWRGMDQKMARPKHHTCGFATTSNCKATIFLLIVIIVLWLWFSLLSFWLKSFLIILLNIINFLLLFTRTLAIYYHHSWHFDWLPLQLAIILHPSPEKCWAPGAHSEMLTGTSEAVLWLNGIHNESLGKVGTLFFFGTWIWNLLNFFVWNFRSLK